MNVSRLVTGLVLITLGFFLIILSIFKEPVFIFLFYGIPVLIVGVVILFNSKEDKIEKIKRRRK